MGSFFCVIFGYGFYGVAADFEGELLIFRGDEAYPRGRALPTGWGAVGGVVCRFAQGLFEDGLAASELHDDGGELAAIVGDSAVGDAVAVPVGRGGVGIKFRQSG